jgi:hypothetical protein
MAQYFASASTDESRIIVSPCGDQESGRAVVVRTSDSDQPSDEQFVFLRCVVKSGRSTKVRRGCASSLRSATTRRQVCSVVAHVDFLGKANRWSDPFRGIRTCLKYLYPLLQPGGVLYSQDGHLPLVCDLFDGDKFWEQEVGVRKPAIEGLRNYP